MTLLSDFIDSRAATEVLGLMATVQTADGTSVFVFQEVSDIDPNVFDINLATIGADENLIMRDGAEFSPAGVTTNPDSALQFVAYMAIPGQADSEFGVAFEYQIGDAFELLTVGAVDDVLNIGIDDDIIYDNTGNHTIYAGNGYIHGGVDNDTLMGGKNADTFAFGKGDGSDVIEDFGNGADAMGLSSMEIAFGDLFVSQDESAAVIEAVDVTIRLENVDVDDLDEASLLL